MPKRPAELALPAPGDLEVFQFEVAGEEYTVLSFSVPQPQLPAGLSLAEQNVVRAVLDGDSNAEIAARRKTSKHTVANQLRSIYGKLGVSGRSELIRHCVDASQAQPKNLARR